MAATTIPVPAQWSVQAASDYDHDREGQVIQFWASCSCGWMCDHDHTYAPLEATDCGLDHEGWSGHKQEPRSAFL